MIQKNRSLLPGIILIIIGAFILLRNLALFRFYWSESYPIFFILLGLVLIVAFIFYRSKSYIFWGSVFLMLGIFFMLRNYDIIDYFFMDEVWPIFLIILGIAFLVKFLVDPKDFGALIPAGILLFIGIINLLRALHYWEAYDYVKQYWPLLIVIVGLNIIITAMIKNRNSMKTEQKNQ
jgi:hypothetical protein